MSQRALHSDFCLPSTSHVPWQSVQNSHYLLEGKWLFVLKELLAEVTKLLLCIVPFTKATFSLSWTSPKGILCCSLSLIGAKPSGGNKSFPCPPTGLACSKNFVAFLLSLFSSEKPMEATHFTCRSLLC